MASGLQEEQAASPSSVSRPELDLDHSHDEKYESYDSSDRHSQPVERLSRNVSRRSGIEETAINALATVRSRRPYAPFTHPLSHVKTSEDMRVTFDGKDDPYNPVNWPFRKKVITTALYGLTTMGATWASSVYSPAIAQISERFHVGSEVSILGISFLLCGFALGPLIWAPLSEVYGRKPAVLIPYFISIMFAIGSGSAKDIQTLLITRFFAGFFGSAPVTNTGGVLGDLWRSEQRGIAIVGYSMAVVGGPVLGPIVGSAIVTSHLRWRWTEFITAIMQMLFLVLDVVLLDESYPAVLLVYKARRLRHETGNWALHAEHEEWDVSLRQLANKYLIRPVQLLVTPICFLVSLYAGFVYAILYANLAAFPVVFEENRGWGQVVGSLPFLALLIGLCMGAALNIMNQKFYVKRFHANNDRPVPEARLPPMMIGSIALTAGLFIFGWTGDREIFWIAPCIGIVLVGLGFLTVFQAALNYLIDTFIEYAASAVAATTFLRSALAAAFPLFVGPMLHNIGIGWGISIFGFFSVLLIPIPFLFFIFGKRIRARGQWSKASV